MDGQTSGDYAADLEANLQSLLNRAKSGTYFAPPVRRVHIPKGTGKETRPIGIPTFEDKVLQRAAVMVLESVYEQDFLDCSYGFRPGRSPHQALISPMLSNVYLHYVLDVWFAEVVKPRMAGRAFLVRFADDFVMGFEREDDARRVLAVLPKRFEKYGLTLHPTKTRLVRFTRPARQDSPSGDDDGPGPGSFDLLGFTHYWGRSLKGNWVIKRKTSKSRLSRAVKAIRQWCRQHRHLPVGRQQQTLADKLRGHYAYYGVTCNGRALNNFYQQARLAWKKWLARRSQRAQRSWDWFAALLKRYPLPPPRLVRRYRT